MRKSFFILFIAFSFVFCCAYTEDNGNKKYMKQYRNDVVNIKKDLKAGKNLEKNENTLRRYLADSLFQNSISLNALLVDVIKRAYEVGNEKVYLKQNLDSVCFFNTARRMFLACETLDSLDADSVSHKKGSGAMTYRKKNADYLLPYRNNLLAGMRYFYMHEKWENAWNCVDTYLDARIQPLFQGCELDTLNDGYASYIAMMSAVKMDSVPLAMKYIDEGFTYDSREEANCEILADMMNRHNRDSLYLSFLKKGFEINPLSHYFYPRLFDYYIARNDSTEAMRYIDEVLKRDSLNETCLLAKHVMLMNHENYEEALKYGLILLAINDSVANPNYNVGLIYYLKAQKTASVKGKSYRQRQKDAQEWYKKCRPYMERYRILKPDQIQRWRPILYDVYLNLNMGKEFSEIESVKP